MRPIFPLLFFVLLALPVTAAERVSQDLLAVNDFAETQGRVVADTSGIQPPLDSEISQPAAGAPPVIDDAALLPPPLSRPVDFVTEVQPLLRDACFDCHSSGNEEGSLNLGIRQRTLEGGEHGPVLLPGNSAGSRLVHLIAGLEPERMMPPEGERLTAEQIGLIRAWIDQGAAWPADADMLDPRTERAREHWAFQPLGTPRVPVPRPVSSRHLEPPPGS
jgi:hypothetical protein